MDRDAAPLLAAQQRVWLRADSAYSCRALVSPCRQRGWDYAVSVTDPRKKAPVLRQVAAMELREDEWEPLPTESRERAVAVVHRPARWPEEPVYVVIRRDGDGEQRWLAPVSTVILGSPDRWPRAELGRRPRGQQGPEQACEGPWTDLGLQQPPCRSHAANQGFYLGPRSRGGGGNTRCCRPQPRRAQRH